MFYFLEPLRTDLLEACEFIDDEEEDKFTFRTFYIEHSVILCVCREG